MLDNHNVMQRDKKTNTFYSLLHLIHNIYEAALHPRAYSDVPCVNFVTSSENSKAHFPSKLTLGVKS